MRLRCVVVVLVFTFTACCYGLANAEDSPTIKNPELSTSADTVKRYLKGSTFKTEVGEERALVGLTSLKSLFEKFPKLDKLKSLIKENPALTSAKVYVSKRPKLKAAVSVARGFVKPLAIIAAIALSGGYIVYLIKG